MQCGKSLPLHRKKGIDIGEKEIARQEKTVMTIPPENKPIDTAGFRGREADRGGNVCRNGSKMGKRTWCADANQ